MKKTLLIFSLIVGMACVVFADGARTPIYDTTPITQPGHYYLTQNISSSSDPVITIASDDVTLDLNGFLVFSPTTGNTLIGFTNFSNITIQNGRLSGGATGIWQGGANETRAHIENVEIRNVLYKAIDIMKARNIEVINCRIQNTGTSAISVHRL